MFFLKRAKFRSPETYILPLKNVKDNIRGTSPLEILSNSTGSQYMLRLFGERGNESSCEYVFHEKREAMWGKKWKRRKVNFRKQLRKTKWMTEKTTKLLQEKSLQQKWCFEVIIYRIRVTYMLTKRVQTHFFPNGWNFKRTEKDISGSLLDRN